MKKYYQKNSILSFVECWQTFGKNLVNFKDVIWQLLHPCSEGVHVGARNVIIAEMLFPGLKGKINL